MGNPLIFLIFPNYQYNLQNFRPVTISLLPIMILISNSLSLLGISSAVTSSIYSSTIVLALAVVGIL